MSGFETDYFNKFTESVFGVNGSRPGGGGGGGSIPACGADCLRMMLLRQNKRNASSIKLQISSIKTSLEFCNKLKNVTSFIFLVRMQVWFDPFSYFSSVPGKKTSRKNAPAILERRKYPHEIKPRLTVKRLPIYCISALTRGPWPWLS